MENQLEDCEDIKNQLDNSKLETKNFKNLYDECISSNYKYKENMSLMNLLKIIKKEKNLLHVKDFLDLFPVIGTAKVSCNRSVVYEALWIIIFVLKLDDLLNRKGKRIIKHSVEKDDFVEVDYKTKNEADFFRNTNVNTSNDSGIVDIYFEDHYGVNADHSSDEKGYICENTLNKTDTSGVEIIKYLYSSKYYLNDKKKGIGSFDIEKIYTEAINKFKTEKFKIGILAKDIGTVLAKCSASKKISTSILDKNISYGIGNLNIYYQRLIKKLEQCDLDSKNPFSKNLPFKAKLIPKFHQKYFVEYTNKKILDGNKKFIWGAVPRSGKSFMIGSLIAKRQPKVVLIILGAVSETHSQFAQMFQKFPGSFDYNIVDISESQKRIKKFDKIKLKEKNIVIVSQQQLWQNNRASAIFPIFAEKNLKTYLVFQNYWKWKHKNENATLGQLVAPRRKK